MINRSDRLEACVTCDLPEFLSWIINHPKRSRNLFPPYLSISLSLYLFSPSNYNLVVIHTHIVMYSNILRIDPVFLLCVFDIFLGISLHFLSLSNLRSPLFSFSFIFVSNVLLQRGIGLIIALIFKHHRSSRRYSSIPWDRVAGGGEGERERETGHWQSGTLMPINYVLGTTCTLLPPSLQHLRLGCWLVFIDIMLAYVVYISYRSIGTSRYILARLVWRMPPNCEHCPDR